MFKIRESALSTISAHLCKAYIRISASRRSQTLTEYALIFVALSLAAFAAYESIGNNVVALGNVINNDLTSA